MVIGRLPRKRLPQDEYNRIAGRYMEVISSPNTTDLQKEQAMFALGEFHLKYDMDQRPMGQS